MTFDWRQSVALSALLLAMLSPARAGPADDRLQAIIDDYWEFTLRENPAQASSVGVNDYNDRLGSVTPEARERRAESERGYLRRLRDIDSASLDEAGKINAEVFAWVLEDAVRAHELNLARIPFNTFSGFYMSALTASRGVAMRSVADYEDYLSRLADIPRFFDEHIANMREGVVTGFVMPLIVIDGVLPTIAAQVKANPEDSSLFEPFAAMSDRVSIEEQARLRDEARVVISGAVMPAFARLARFFEEEYEASDTVGAFALAEGADYYAFNIKRYTTMPDITADEIHRTGLREVARIRAEMEAIIEALEFDGGFAAFSEFLRTDPQFFAKNADELLKEAAYIAKRIDYRMPGFFGHLPRQPYGVVPVPDEIAPNYTTGAYYGAPPGGVHGGAFWVNTHALEQRPLNELPALTLHEAVPGHHHQAAISLELEGVPEFRRNLYFSAFGEGWALYAEKLGIEMGIYRTPYEDFGRLSYEMWRACRLVVDTGLHSQGWSRQQALDYFHDNTSLSAGNIRAEVDRYISWPGQALAYKLGELKIWELRRIAEHELGEGFDLREFHDVILENGAVPLALLEREVLEWIVDSSSQQ